MQERAEVRLWGRWFKVKEGSLAMRVLSGREMAAMSWCVASQGARGRKLHIIFD